MTEQNAGNSKCTTRHQCGFCQSNKMHMIIDFGSVALAGGFLRPENFKNEPKFPMRLFFCEDCYAVQLIDIVDADVLFKDYFYFSSAVTALKEHFKDYATEVSARFLEQDKSMVVEFGCNDGVLLKPFADLGIKTLVGVDPATNIVNNINDKRINIVNDYFGVNSANDIKDRFGSADLIVANNVYAHIPDINGVTQGVHNLLKEDGVFVFEVHYLPKVIRDLQYDMIYHEHLYYYSLIALINHFARFNMTVFDVKPIPIHAGSVRYYVCKNESKHAKNISNRVAAMKQSELNNGYHRLETFANFAQNIEARKETLMDLLELIRGQGKTIAGYGASGRANTIIQYSGITHQHIEYMIDDAPAKAGVYTPGSHFLIHPPSILKKEATDYLLVFAWGYFNEIAEKCSEYMKKGGRLIQPLPNVRVSYQPTTLDCLKD